MDALRIILAILLPPLGVFLQVGIGPQFWLNVLLTILGYVPGEFQNNSEEFWNRLLHPDDFDAVMAGSVEATKTKQPYRQEYRLIASDGRVVWILDESVMVRDDPDTGTALASSA